MTYAVSVIILVCLAVSLNLPLVYVKGNTSVEVLLGSFLFILLLLVAVLKLDYARVIDTSYIFQCSDRPFHMRPSLNSLCKASSKDIYLKFMVSPSVGEFPTARPIIKSCSCLSML